MSPSSTRVIEDCIGLIKILGDGSIVRSPDPAFPIPINDDDNVVWRQLEFDSTHNLDLRLYKPREVGASKLPVVFYFHGGAFCFGSCSWPHMHNCCVRLSSELNAVVVAPDYRLAPEHRLPAAFDDAESAVKWVLSARDLEWLSDVADFDNVVIIGDSSGGLIAHELAIRFGSGIISKYVLLGPFFGAVERTETELDCPDNSFLNLAMIDQFWRLALPVGADRDHPFANPLGPKSADLGRVEFAPMVIVVGEKDLLRDRGVKYGERLKELGKPVEVIEFEGQEHGFFTDKPYSNASVKLMEVLKRFVNKNSS